MRAQKVAITSPLPQTTRKDSRVIYSDQRGKIIISDTPGIMAKIDDLIGRRINKEAPKELNQADVILCVVDISRPKNEEENIAIIVYTKVNYNYVINYYKDSISEDNFINRVTGTANYKDTINVEEEKAKLQEEINYLQGFLTSVEKKLSNPSFVQNAPEKVVDVERKKQNDARQKLSLLQEKIERLK